MLQAIREKAQGWIAWAIVILISIPFALWGIQEYLGVGGEPEVAVVDGEPITERMLDQRVRDFREQIRLSLGDAYRADLFDEVRLKREVLDQMVEEMVLAKNAQDWNLRTSDAQARGFIASIPAFQREGRFDQQTYEAAVRNRGMSRAGFEQSIRQDMTLAQLRAGVRDTAFVTRTDLANRIRLRDEQRTIAYARIPAAAYSDQVSPTEDDLRAFYDANQERYRTPERVRLDYLVLDASTLGGLVEADEAALRQYYNDHRGEFIAREEREMRHILFSVPAGADEQAVAQIRDEAAAVAEQLRSGADFAELAKSRSDDPGSAQAGGDLGVVERGIMVPAFEEAAFALQEGSISDPVRTDFGFHVIQVTDVRGGSDATFEDLREQVEAAYRKFEAESLYFDYAERLAESAYENSASLTPAAEALGLTVQSSDWTTRDDQLPAPLDSPKVINAAFSDDVLMEGHNSELIEVGPQQALVVRVAEHQPAGIKSFADNKAQIEQDYRRAKASEAAAETGRKALQQLAAGKTLAQLAADHAWQLQQPGAVGRQDAGVPPEVLDKAFALTPPSEENRAYDGVPSADGDYLLVEVQSVEGGKLEQLADAERPLVAEQVVGQVSNAQLNNFTASLRNRTDIEIKLSEQ